MEMKPMPVREIVVSAAALGLALAMASPGRTLAAAANPFDGTWNAEVVCPSSADAQGYTWRLPLQISSGTLSGIYHSPTTQAQGELSGWVRPDGKALVGVLGRTGRNDKYAIGHIGPGIQFRYTANVQFAGDSGSGQRQQLRPCTLTFSKA
jgi:hypothetical protein